MQSIIDYQIECVRDRLKYLETPSCRRKMTKENIDIGRKVATDLFRSLLNIKNNIIDIQNIKKDIDLIDDLY
jgi:hypothetical protein